jgi:hypothetical protein
MSGRALRCKESHISAVLLLIERGTSGTCGTGNVHITDSSRNCQFQSCLRTSQHFMKCRGSLLCSQEASPVLYPESDQFSSYHLIPALFKIHFNIIPYLYFLGYRSGGPCSIPGTTKKKVVGLERSPLSLVSATEELLDRKVAAPV